MKRIGVNENPIKASKKKLTGTHYWWILWTKKIGMALFVIIALGACTGESEVRLVKKCAKVVDVKMFQSYFLGLPDRGPNTYKILDTGERVRIDPADYYKWGKDNWFRNTKEMEIGHDYCRTNYERIKA